MYNEYICFLKTLRTFWRVSEKGWHLVFEGGRFRDRVFLYSPGCPGTHAVDQAGLELRNPPASASQVLGLKACATILNLTDEMLKIELNHLSSSDLINVAVCTCVPPLSPCDSLAGLELTV
jgi:hypothetical protein